MENSNKKNIFYSLLLLFTIIISCLFYLHFIYNTSFVYHGIRYFTLFDDSMIGMRYAKNLASGNGLVYNVNEYVEGYTNFLWTIYMYLVHLLPVHESKLPLIITLTSLLLLFVNIYYSKQTCSYLLKNYLPDVTVYNQLIWIYIIVFIGWSYALIFWSFLGVETGAICAIINYILYRIVKPHESERRNILELSILCVLLYLIRMDNIIFIFTIFLFLLLFKGKNIRFFVIPILFLGVTIILQTIFRSIYYDDYLPNTYYLKVSIPLKERLYYGGLFMLGSFKKAIGAIGVITAGCMLLLYRSKNKEWLNGIMILGMAIVYSIYVGGDSWEGESFINRYLIIGVNAFTPSLLVMVLTVGQDSKRLKDLQLILLASFAMALMYFLFFYHSPSSEKYLNRFGNSTLFLISCLFIQFVFLIYALLFKFNSTHKNMVFTTLIVLMNSWMHMNLYSFVRYYWYKSENQVGLSKSLSIIGLEVRGHTSKDTRFGVILAGAMPYYSDRYCADLLGKCDKYIAKSFQRKEAIYKSGHMKWDYQYSINKYHPDILLYLWAHGEKEMEMIHSQFTDYNGFYIKKGSESKLDNVIMKEITLNQIGIDTPQQIQ